MVCAVCGRPADCLVYRESSGGRREESQLCWPCARNRERILCGDGRLMASDVLLALIENRLVSAESRNRTKVCPVCGNTADGVLESGVVGCSECYEVFRDEIKQIVRDLHGVPIPEQRKLI